MEAKWLTTEEAAEYLGMGKTKLYSLSQSGRIPVSKVGKKWLYEQQALAEWLRANKSIESFFLDTAANVEGNASLEIRSATLTFAHTISSVLEARKLSFNCR